eukprot:758449-Hanusia_phi.AAC.5
MIPSAGRPSPSSLCIFSWATRWRLLWKRQSGSTISDWVASGERERKREEEREALIHGRAARERASAAMNGQKERLTISLSNSARQQERDQEVTERKDSESSDAQRGQRQVVRLFSSLSRVLTRSPLLGLGKSFPAHQFSTRRTNWRLGSPRTSPPRP